MSTKKSKKVNAGAAVSAAVAPDVAPTSMVRVVRRGSCKSVSGKSELKYELGIDSRDAVQLRVVDNSGSGSFSDAWVRYNDVQAALDRAPRGQPATAHLLQPLFRHKSSNCCHFTIAVLQSEGLLKPADKKHRYLPVDPAPWLAELKALADGKRTAVSADATVQSQRVKEPASSKPKKAKKPAKAT